MFILSLVSGSWHLIEDMGPPVQLLLQQSKYFHGNKNLHLFYKAWDDRGKYRIRTPTSFFFHTTYVNSLPSEYKHMTILFSKENDTNEWMILFLLKIIHYTNIDFAQFEKIKYKNLYLIHITKTYSKALFVHFIYNTTIPWHSKINRKMIQLA